MRSNLKKDLLRIGVLLLLAYLCAVVAYYYHKNHQYEKRVSALEKERLELNAKIAELSTELNNSREEIKRLKRPSGEVVVEVPADCKSCFEKYEYEYVVVDKNKRWKFYDSNVFDNEPGELTLLPKFYDEYIIPCQESLDKCLQELKKYEPRAREYIRAGASSVTIGIGISGYYAEFDYYFLSFGKTLKVSIGLDSFLLMPPTGDLSDISYNVGVGIRVDF